VVRSCPCAVILKRWAVMVLADVVQNDKGKKGQGASYGDDRHSAVA
jgi:hypothetical protein